MSTTARDLVLELYKKDNISKEETSILLDAISQNNTNVNYYPYKGKSNLQNPYDITY